MKDLSLKFLTIIILVFGLWLSGVFITAIWSEDIDAKNEPEHFRSEWRDLERPPAMLNDPVDDMQQDFIIKLHENSVEHGNRSIANKDNLIELTNLFKEVLDQEDRLIDIIEFWIERVKKLEQNQYFPTWPNYIELEKDIYFDIPDQNAPDGMWKKVRWPLPKGTKIYFKDKE